MNRLISLVFGAALVMACGACGDSPSNPPPAGNSSGFFIARQDTRKCAAPMCGGAFVRKVNAANTVCADGTSQAECYVSDFDLAALSLPAEQSQELRNLALVGQALIKGTVEKWTHELGTFGKLVATEGWRAASPQVPTGTFLRVFNNGKQCVAAPCASLTQVKLNIASQRDLTDLVLTSAGATPEWVTRATDAVQTSAILVAGTNKEVPNAGPAGAAYVLTASQFYLKETPKPTAPVQ